MVRFEGSARPFWPRPDWVKYSDNDHDDEDDDDDDDKDDNDNDDDNDDCTAQQRCQAGWTGFKGHCYIIPDMSVTWDTAQVTLACTCFSRNGGLVLKINVLWTIVNQRLMNHSVMQVSEIILTCNRCSWHLPCMFKPNALHKELQNCSLVVGAFHQVRRNWFRMLGHTPSRLLQNKYMC